MHEHLRHTVLVRIDKNVIEPGDLDFGIGTRF
jgi:hypothetical protein